MRGLVAIVGRANVGKSTLFNRLIGYRKAIVDDRPGVTRDRIYGVVAEDDEGPGFGLIDTGGFESERETLQPFSENIVWEQSKAAIAEADVLLLVVDARHGIHPWDEHLSQLLKRSGKPVIYVVNKVDGLEQLAYGSEFYRLGITSFVAVSAAHNRGVGELRETIRQELSQVDRKSLSKEYDSNASKVAIVGRPNVGKSSILNRLLGKSRALVSDVAGTTRDTVDTPFVYNKKPYVLLDTAGIRRRSRIDEKLEGLSVMRSLQAIEDADVVILVLDASEGFTDQDAKLASLASRRYKPLLVVVNKWDLVPNKKANTAKEYAATLRRNFSSLAVAPMLFVSCINNQRVHDILQHVESLREISGRRVETARLNELLQRLVKEHTPALIRARSKRVKFYYGTQVRSRPPTFVIKCNLADEIQESYKRYLTKKFQSELGFNDVPIHMIFRGKGDVRPSRYVSSHEQLGSSEQGETPRH